MADEFTWQFLERRPYGLALWDLATFQGKEAVVFMAREPRDTVEALPRKIDVRWKVGLMEEGNAYLVMVLILVIELQSISLMQRYTVDRLWEMLKP